MRNYLASLWVRGPGIGFPYSQYNWAELLKAPSGTKELNHRPWETESGPALPLPNVWVGVSVENQATANERLQWLLRTPAAVRWISAEPLLEQVNLLRALMFWWNATRPARFWEIPRLRERLHWVVCGGESGPGARPMHPAWARNLRDQCAAAGVPFFFKQWGQHLPSCQILPLKLEPSQTKTADFWRSGNATLNTYNLGKKRAGRLLDGVEHNGYPEQPNTGADGSAVDLTPAPSLAGKGRKD